MPSSNDARVPHWRRSIVDVLIGAATLAVAFAAIGTTARIPYLLLIAGALVGIGLMLEPNAAAQAASGIGPQPLRLFAESGAARPEPQERERFDALIADAASV